MTGKEKIVDRIRKLLALSKSSNQFEAELALSKAQELMTEHQIGMSAVEIKESMGGVTHELFTVPGVKLHLLWPSYVAWGAARFYDGTILLGPMKKGKNYTDVYFIGQPADIELMKTTTEMLMQFWLEQVERDLTEVKIRRGYDAVNAGWTPKMTMDFKQGHAMQYATRVYHRCKQLTEARKIKVQSSGRDLVVLKQRESEDYAAGLSGGKTKRNVSQGSQLGRVFGERAGQNVAIAAGMIDKE